MCTRVLNATSANWKIARSSHTTHAKKLKINFGIFKENVALVLCSSVLNCTMLPDTRAYILTFNLINFVTVY